MAMSAAVERWSSRLLAAPRALWRRYPKCCWTALLLVSPVAALKLTVRVWVDRGLEQRADATYSLAPKQWIPRGFHGHGVPANSLRSVQAAFERGARGVEVDFHYDPHRDRFVVSHAKPRIDAQGERHFDPLDGRDLSLDELMQETAEGHYYWWDFKNLGDLDPSETTRAIARLELTGAIHGVKGRAYIEGSDPFRLARYRRAGFHTILAFQPGNERWPGSSLKADLAKLLVWSGEHDGLAIRLRESDLEDFGRATRASLRHVPVFLFHVPPDRALVAELVALPQVRVLLVGRDVSVDLLDVEGLPTRR
jgi:hypothetical protein